MSNFIYSMRQTVQGEGAKKPGGERARGELAKGRNSQTLPLSPLLQHYPLQHLQIHFYP